MHAPVCCDRYAKCIKRSTRSGHYHIDRRLEIDAGTIHSLSIADFLLLLADPSAHQDGARPAPEAKLDLLKRKKGRKVLLNLLNPIPDHSPAGVACATSDSSPACVHTVLAHQRDWFGQGTLSHHSKVNLALEGGTAAPMSTCTNQMTTSHLSVVAHQYREICVRIDETLDSIPAFCPPLFRPSSIPCGKPLLLALTRGERECQSCSDYAHDCARIHVANFLEGIKN
ncbi:hypothetical protein BaRGS_00035251 [Batillaria attramentaria]|uniref:Uncharacterized protein n=1 Tax=Batillaria attramentaria TaxID=370345 RepID=A0ABD0JEW2_9CAEN